MTNFRIINICKTTERTRYFLFHITITVIFFFFLTKERLQDRLFIFALFFILGNDIRFQEIWKSLRIRSHISTHFDTFLLFSVVTRDPLNGAKWKEIKADKRARCAIFYWFVDDFLYFGRDDSHCTRPKIQLLYNMVWLYKSTVYVQIDEIFAQIKRQIETKYIEHKYIHKITVIWVTVRSIKATTVEKKDTNMYINALNLVFKNWSQYLFKNKLRRPKDQ